MREDAGVNIAASPSTTKQLFLLKYESQTVFTSSRAALETFKTAHLNADSGGLTFLRWSAVSPAGQLLAPL